MKPTVTAPSSVFAAFAATARFALDERRARYTTALQALAAKVRAWQSPVVNAELEEELAALRSNSWPLTTRITFGALRRLRLCFERDTLAILAHLPADVKAVVLSSNIVPVEFHSRQSSQDWVAA